VVETVHKLRKSHLSIDADLVKFQKLRELVDSTGDLVSKLTQRLPSRRDENFPDLYEFLRM